MPRLRCAMNGTSRGISRARQEPSTGLLGERRMREPSNGPSEARSKQRMSRSLERPQQDAEGRVAWRGWKAEPSNNPSAAR